MGLVRRGQSYVDGKVQGALAVRMIVYWFYCLMTVSMMLVVWTLFSSKPQTSDELFQQTWNRGGPALVGSLLLLPVVLLDCLRMSNRFVGPIFRLRRELKRLANDQPAKPIVLRKGDFWFDFVEDYNRLLTKLQPSHVPPLQPESQEKVG